MSAIRSDGNRSTEVRFRLALVRGRVKGWRIHARGLIGKPDIFFPAERIAVFLDGCYWHGCGLCRHSVRVNAAYWSAKIQRNQERDRANNQRLHEDGVQVIRLWEHEIRDDLGGCLRRIQQALAGTPTIQPLDKTLQE
jgi:DNA mismatch endonuclease Vsr